MRELDRFYESLEERLYYQLKLITQKRRRPKKIFSAVHNAYVVFAPNELAVLDSFPLQRLRGISHLGLAYFVHPESKHSRYDHSVGTFYLAKEVIRNFEERRERLDDKIIKKNLPMAALLHDAGHYPFSHVSEMALDLNHQLRSANIILGRDEIVNRVWKKYNGDHTYKLLYEYLCRKNYSPELIAHWITPKVPLKVKNLKAYEDFALISGPVDLDALDYLVRDSFFTGTPYGSVDIKRMLAAFSIAKKNGKKVLGIEEKALDSVIHFLLGNEMSYNAIACHHAVRIAESMLKTGILHAAEILTVQDLSQFLLHLGIMNDEDLLKALEIISKEFDDKMLKEIVPAIAFRQLYKSVEIKSTDKTVDQTSMRNMCESIKPLTPNPLEEVPERLTLYLTKKDLAKEDEFEWAFKGSLIIVDAKGMPALHESYIPHAAEKLDGKGRNRPLYIIKKSTGPTPITEFSANPAINPQTLIANYTDLTASLLCIGTRQDRDKDRLELFRHDGYSYLCRFLKLASIKKAKILHKVEQARTEYEKPHISSA